MAKEVFLEYTEATAGGDPVEGDDWCYKDQHVDFRPIAIGITRSKHSWRNETINVDFEPKLGQDVDLIVVRYRTGSTFGTIYGVWQMIGVYASHQKALEIRDGIYRHQSSPDELKKLLGKGFFPSWLGYFEEFNEVELHCMRLRD